MVRNPEMVSLDIRSLIACNNVARDRFRVLIRKYGEEIVDGACMTLIDQSEQLLRDRLRELPNGKWQSRQYMDVNAEVHRVGLTMTKEDDHLVFDFSDSSPESPYSINCAYWASWGGLFAPLFPLLCYDITWNEGVIRPIEMIAPEGTIVNCRRPAPVSVATVGAIQSVNNAACTTIGKMLAASEKYKGEATAVWHANHFAIFLFGQNQRGGQSIGILTETFAGAGGARSFADGVDVGGEVPNPISRMANVESMEAAFPLRYLFRRRMKDSGGAGEYRGGVGAELAFGPHDAPDGGLHYVVSGKGTQFPMSEGLNGGYPGAPNSYLWVHSNEETAGDAPLSFAQSLESMPGEKESVTWGVYPIMGRDGLYVQWNGGGGYGDPLERDPAAVVADFEEGVVSEWTLRNVYGVVIDGDAGELDGPGTEAARKAARGTRLQREAAE
jgi:N-methylhydantoinase B